MMEREYVLEWEGRRVFVGGGCLSAIASLRGARVFSQKSRDFCLARQEKTDQDLLLQVRVAAGNGYRAFGTETALSCISRP
jgi:hypothetical protein